MKKLRPFLFLACLCIMGLLSFNTPVQESMQVKNILGKLLLYSKNERPEKTYLHTDKDFYTNGETIWFKTYLVDGIDHRASDKSKVVYVELIDSEGNILERRKQFVSDLGAEGEIQLEQKLAQGEYTLRAYTKYMLNEEEPVFFEKKIPIWMQQMTKGDVAGIPQNSTNSGVTDVVDEKEGVSKTKVRFFPEGGQLVTGMSSKLGLEVTDGQGNGLALQGTIVDQDGNVAADFRSGEFGLGVVNLRPLSGKTYYARLDGEATDSEFELPRAMPEGYLLNVTDRGEHILVQVATNLSDGLQGALLLGHLRGEVFLKQVVNGYGTKEHAVKIYPDQLKEGVAQFTLFTAKGEPVSERLFFVENPDQRASLSIDTDRKSYGTRDRVQVDLALTDSQGKSLEGEFSMSVVSKNALSSEYSGDIRSWLLLDSDVGATVPDAGYFFRNASKDRKQLLDALMLTHGWRRFKWSQLLEKKTSKKLRFPPEKGITISGRAVNYYDNEKFGKSLASLTLMGEDLVYDKDSTDNNGRFAFGSFFFQDSVDAILQAEGFGKRPKVLDILLDAPYPENMPAPRKIQYRETRHVEPNNDYMANAYRQKVADFTFDPDKVTLLEEATVTAKRPNPRDVRNRILTEQMDAKMTTGQFSDRVHMDSIQGTETLSALELLRYSRYSFRRGITSVNAGTGALYLVDGVVASPDFISSMRANEIQFVDIVTGPDATLWGVRGAGGVIAFYTKKGIYLGDETKDVPGIINTKIIGFNKVREFYTPNYSVDRKEHEKPDYRSTLLWEPNIMLKKEGDNKLEFFTGDNPGNYLIKVEGLTVNGVPVSETMELEVDSSN
ncbi:hypothetical protein PP182_16335 [Maribacter sp. PR1]|uniref:TonB-dependent receptor plug domain-containing protein n=1 Tax=Maribacter cobaltidurans TaxID=1178778 RepID=A0ABU7IXD3_9FLAO|nr:MULTISPECIES: hypothetical protein [Maribacter]MDC6390259.1 hypothetical protein [Maribacter sp. PR1]MEE1977649.1 hypothetical protein [Maribacter cobaltidurans]